MKEDRPSDEQIQAMLHRPKLQEPELYCPSEKRIIKICLNPDCGVAPTCNDIFCQNCGIDVHPTCPSINVAQVTGILNEINSKYKEFMQKTFNIQTCFIKEFQKLGKQMTIKALQNHHQKKKQFIVDYLFKEKDISKVSGADSNKFIQRLRVEYKYVKEELTKAMSTYSRQLGSLLNNIKTLKQALYDSLQSKWNFKSKIIDDEDFLSFSYLDNILKNPRRFELLYRGSENNFKASIFHQKCDNIPNTLTIVKTHFGKIIGGFTKYTWNQVENQHYVEDLEKQAFLFSLQDRKKIVPISQKKLIYCDNSRGPCFGYQDLWISDNQNESLGDFPDHYNYQGQERAQRNEASFQKFTGSTKKQFRIAEYEVFRVVYQ